MPHALQILAAAAPGFLRLGPLHFPIFGVVATAGLLAALTLSRRTAPLAGLDPNRLWDAGVLAVVSAFAVSRLLLIAVNLRLFLAHPLLVLFQPSLTLGGLVLTAGILWLWLRRHHLPLRNVLDAYAAPAALLAAALQLGHFFEGTDVGMPTTLPWGVHARGDLTFTRLHPVQLYAAAGYLVLCAELLHMFLKPKLTVFSTGAQQSGETPALRLPAWLWYPHRQNTGVSPRRETVELFRSGRKDEYSETSLNQLRHPIRRGSIAAAGLLFGGTLSFALSFLRQPYDPLGTSWLDPSQYISLIALLAGCALFATVMRERTQPVATPAHFPAEEPC